MPILSDREMSQILRNELHDPFDTLGMHREKQGGISVRAYVPEAKALTVLSHEKSRGIISAPMQRIHHDGIFEIYFPECKDCFKYQLQAELHDGGQKTFADPYSFLPIIPEQARYLFNEGNNQRVYDDLGSHVRTIDGVKGTLFAVWAPAAKRVSVVGGFNGWDGRRHPMRILGTSGVWELFIPGLAVGDIYKYEIKKHDQDHLILKTDPYGYFQEPPPNHASIIWDLDSFHWEDDGWMKHRQGDNLLINRPMSIYEVHLGSWKKAGPSREGDWFSYRDLAHQLAAYVKKMGYTHIELMPVQDHPYVPSWGYQVGGFYAPNHRFGTPADFQYFINYLHKQGIGIIMDWVPGHFPKDAYGLAYFDGTHLYEHRDPREGEHKDWGTLIFNFGRNEVRNFLVANALFWLEKFHIDGLRVDAVASMLYRNYSRKNGEWIPNKYGGVENLEAVEFLKQMNTLVHEKFPGAVTIAEESTAWPMVSRPTYTGGLGFTFKWNMGWMNDNLTYFSKNPIYRRYHHNQLTFGMWYAYTENFVLVISHDEVVHGKRSLLEKMPGDNWQKFANVRAFFGYFFGHPGKKLMFQGCEFGMHWEWDCQQSINWHILDEEPDKDLHRGLQQLVSDLNAFYVRESCLWEFDYDQAGFEWIDHRDSDNSVVSFMRKCADKNKLIVVVSNFTPVVREAYRIGVPEEGFYKEVINTDARDYGGSGKGNCGGLQAEAHQWHGRPYSLNTTLPPLGTVIFKWERKK
jgi:1,4-alpha-glucan branching enzyme